MQRRQFLAGSAALAGAAALGGPPARAGAANSIALRATSRTLEVNGKAAKVLGLLRADGGQGLTMDSGQDFDVALTNALDEPTLIHWHGLTPPWSLDGVVGTPAKIMAPGETRAYRFPVAEGGTHWMHAHTLQEQSLLAAPLIVRDPAEAKDDAQEVVLLLHDFSFTPPPELLARLRKGDMPGMDMPGMDLGHGAAMGGMAGMKDMPGMQPGAMAGMADMPGMGRSTSTTSTMTPISPTTARSPTLKSCGWTQAARSGCASSTRLPRPPSTSISAR